MNPATASFATAEIAVGADPRAAMSLGLAWDQHSPLSADNVAARDAVFQMLSLRRALQQLGRAGASTLLAGMALAATGGPVEVRFPATFEGPPTATVPGTSTTNSWRP